MARRNGPRRDLSRADFARRGALVVLVLAVLSVAAYGRTAGGWGAGPEVSATVNNAGGALRSGSDVKMAGVLVGKVKKVSRADGGGVRVDLTMNQDDIGDVPDDVVARILPATVFGTTFVDLVSYDGSAGESLQAGDAIAADQSQETLELQQALDDIDRLVNALGPAELSSALGSLAQALDGRGARIGANIDIADRYLARLNPRMDVVRSDVRKLAQNLEVLDDVAPDLLAATDGALVAFDTIVTQRASIMALISGGTTLVDRAREFISDNEAQLVRNVDNGAILLDALFDNRRAGITGGIAANTLAGRQIPKAVRGGQFKTKAILRLDAPDYYTPADRPSFGGSGNLERASLSGMVAGGQP